MLSGKVVFTLHSITVVLVAAANETSDLLFPSHTAAVLISPTRRSSSRRSSRRRRRLRRGSGSGSASGRE